MRLFVHKNYTWIWRILESTKCHMAWTFVVKRNSFMTSHVNKSFLTSKMHVIRHSCCSVSINKKCLTQWLNTASCFSYLQCQHTPEHCICFVPHENFVSCEGCRCLHWEDLYYVSVRICEDCTVMRFFVKKILQYKLESTVMQKVVTLDAFLGSKAVSQFLIFHWKVTVA